MRVRHLACMLLFGLATVGWAQTAEEIIKNNQKVARPTSSQGTVRLVVNTTGTDVVQNFTIYTRRFDKELRTRINFTRPTQMQFLVYSEPGASTRQWVKLSSGQVRQIAAGNQGGSWANSHFYYEDLSTYSMEDYTFNKLSDTTVLDYHKKPVPAYRVEALPKAQNAVYSKRILYIDKQSSQILKVDFFERGRHTKTLTNYHFTNINGFSTPRLVYMEPTGGGGKYSYLLIENMVFNQNVDAQHFQRATF